VAGYFSKSEEACADPSVT